MTRTLSRRGYYQRIVHAQRLYSKGEGWWEIEMGCGHLAAACVGTASPIGPCSGSSGLTPRTAETETRR